MILLVDQIIEGKHVVLVSCSQVEYRGYFLSFYSRSPVRRCSAYVTIGRMIHSQYPTRFVNFTASRQICVTLAEKDSPIQSESWRPRGPPSWLHILSPLVIHWISGPYPFIFSKNCSLCLLSFNIMNPIHLNFLHLETVETLNHWSRTFAPYRATYWNFHYLIFALLFRSPW